MRSFGKGPHAKQKLPRFHPFPMNPTQNFYGKSSGLCVNRKKRPSRQKQWAIFVFPSAITAEGAAADFDRVPFYRENRGHKKRFI